MFPFVENSVKGKTCMRIGTKKVENDKSNQKIC